MSGFNPLPRAVAGRATCPLCHTPRNRPGWWRCAGCGQAWDDDRLAVVAAYAQFDADRSATPSPGGPVAIPGHTAAAGAVLADLRAAGVARAD